MRSMSIGTQLMPPSENAILMLGEAGRDARPQPVGGGDERVHGEQTRVQRERRAGRARGGPRRRAVVQAEHGLGLLARAQHRIPVVGVDRGQLQVDRVLGEAHGLEAARRVGADVGRPRPRDRRARRAAAGSRGRGADRPTPRCASRSTPASDASPSSWSLLAENTVPAKPAMSDGKHSARVHAVEVHVGDARVDVVAAAAHLVEARGLHVPLVLRAAGDRVQPDLRVEAILVDPRLAAVVERDDAWRARRRGAAGIRPSKRSAGSMRWSSTEMIV